MSVKDIKPGHRFGKWTVVGESFLKDYWRNRKRRFVPVRCECGLEKDVGASQLVSGRSTQCRTCSGVGQITHGEAGTRLYRTWSNMKTRCGNPSNANYARYGGSGVTICTSWGESFETFRKWSLENAYRDDLTIDRIDNERGGYSPTNCRWATASGQARNRCRCRIVVAFNRSLTVVEWSEDSHCNVSYDTLRSRIDLGWPPEAAIALPPHSKRNDPIPTTDPQLRLFT